MIHCSYLKHLREQRYLISVNKRRHKVAEEQRHKVKTFRDLIVWQKAMQLVTQIYLITKGLPKEEIYGLTPQIRRSSVSIPSNIAEGYGRNSTNDYIRFLQIATASLYELQTQLEICLNLEYLSKQIFKELYEKSREIERMISSLIRKLTPDK
ncbi:MAG TPA: four helix bundle protein [Nitrospirae bacterium]|nr:four helix bundle protein [Nitrospirota bacterium]